jgi:PAS domain S-box-containing protein
MKPKLPLRLLRVASPAVGLALLGLSPDAAAAEGTAGPRLAEVAGGNSVTLYYGLFGALAAGLGIRWWLARRRAGQAQARTRELEAVEDRWLLAVRGINDGIWDSDLRTQEVYLSDRCLEMLGFEPGEIKPTRAEWLARVHPDDEPAREKAMAEHIAGRRSHYESEFRMRAKDGTYRWILSRGQIIRNAAGEPVRGVGSHTDVHARRLAEEAMSTSAEQHRLLFEANPTPILVYDVGTLRFLEVNDAAVQLYGYTREEFCAMKVTDIRPPEEVPALMKKIEQVRAGHTGLRSYGVWKHRLKDGRLIDADVSGQMFSVNGRRCYTTFVRDVTVERQSQAALRDSEERFRLLFGNSPIAIMECDYRKTAIWLRGLRSAGVADLGAYLDRNPADFLAAARTVEVTVNDQAVRLLRGESREFVQANLAAAFTGETLEFRRRIFEAIWDGRREYEGESTLRGFDGTVVRVYARWWLPLVNGEPKYEWSQVGLIDLTAIRRTEEALAVERERLKVTLASMVEGVITIDPAGIVRYLNPAAGEMTGWSSEAVGRAIDEVCGLRLERTDLAVQLPLEHVLTTGSNADLPEPTILAARDGTRRLIEGRCAPMHSPADSGVVFVFRDVMERSNLEAERLRTSKLESVSVLAGGIAHDFNNLLTVVMGNLALARDHLTREESPAGPWLREAERGAMRARELTTQLLTFAHGGDPVRTSVGLGEVVREATEFALHGSNVKAEYELAADAWAADADPGQIGRVIQNIVINSVQAMPGGGVIRVTVANEEVPPGARPPLEGGSCLRISIADTGTGIAAEHLARIFDPYFTTKTGGSGLGLSTAYSIVRKHHGHIAAEPAPGGGAVFHIWLPAVAARPSAKRPETHSPFSPLRGRILFMDDEEEIRKMTAALFRQMGLEVVTTADGQEAVQQYQQARDSGHPFDLVLMDLTVPGAMGGREATENLRKIDPAVKVIVSSGYSSDPIMANFRSHGFCGCVAKPYRVRDLTQTLREHLSGR